MNHPWTYAVHGQPPLFSICWVLGLIVLPIFLKAQSTPVPAVQDTTEPAFIIIDHFGKLIEDKQGIESVRWISQGLQLRLDSTYIYADSAVIFGDNKVFAYGDVVIQQGDSLHVFTDTLYYFKESDIATLIGEVVLTQGSKQLWTKNLTYHLGAQYGEYGLGGVMVDKSLQVSSKKGVYYADREEIVFKDSVVVLHPKLNLAADSMRYRGAESLVLFTGPTTLYTPSAKVYCESGFYNLLDDKAEFNKKAQYAGDQKQATADTIRYAAANGEVTMLGHVHVVENEKKIDGDFLRYLENTGETWIKGEPALYADSTRKVRSPEIFYNEKTDQVSTKGSGEIADGTWRMRFEQSDFDQATGLGTFTGDVIWRDTAQQVGIIADTMHINRETEYVLASGARRTLFYTLVEQDTLFIASDTLTMERVMDTLTQSPYRLIRAYDDVRLFKSDLQGKADSLVFNDRDSLFTFFDDPLLWTDTTQFSADTITLSVRHKQIHDITLVQRALIISELYGTYYDQIKGKRVVADFDSSAIRDMWVTGNAESIYYTRDDKSAFIGVNQTICSKMYFTFKDNQIDLLKYFGENSSTMTPMGEAQHDALRLEGFQWREEERPQSVNAILE